MQQQLGGERVGSGNKMTVHLDGFSRSTHDLGYIWRNTQAPGTLVPFLCKVMNPGDTFDIHLNLDGKTHPTVGPLFGSFKVQLDVYKVPMRLYIAALHNNKIGIGMKMKDVKIPHIPLRGTYVPADHPDIDNAQIHPSAIFSYLGLRGVGTVAEAEVEASTNYRDFNAIPLLAYWEIFKQYYSNKQEDLAYVIHKSMPILNPVNNINVGGEVLPEAPAQGQIQISNDEPILVYGNTGNLPDPNTVMIEFWNGQVISFADLIYGEAIDMGDHWFGAFNYAKYGNMLARRWRLMNAGELINGKPELTSFPLADIDEMREYLLAQPATASVDIFAADKYPYKLLREFAYLPDGGLPVWCYQSSQEGLAVKTYQSDLFNNWLSTEWLDGTGGINDITAIDTSSGSFSVESLILAKKVYDMLNRIAVSGGTYNDWIKAVWDHPVPLKDETPIYLGGLIKELVFSEVVSNSTTSSTEGTQPLGTLAGKGVMSSKHKGGTVVVKTDEPCYVIGLCSLTPRLDYSQGNAWDVHLKTLDDLHKPNLDQIGFQELITEQMAWWDTGQEPGTGGLWIQKSAGKQPAWINYMTSVNEVRGNFARQNNEMFMVLNRRYEPESISTARFTIKDLTTYIDPTKFNHIFADTSLDAQNFWIQISVDITARRKMSAKVMPNL